jgi:hypothetical protein
MGYSRVPRGYIGVIGYSRGTLRAFPWRRLAVFIDRRLTRGGHVCVFAFVPSAACRTRSVAGITWTCRTANAPWAARARHTTVIDAAGAIYVIGGVGSGPDYNDVWVSTDGGA